MRGRLTSLSLFAAVAVALSGGCASEEDPYEVAPSLPESMEPVGEGWTWRGEGEAPNFGAADVFCRQFTRNSSPRLAAEMLREQQGGTIASPRVTQQDRRSYWSCLEGRGWSRSSG